MAPPADARVSCPRSVVFRRFTAAPAVAATGVQRPRRAARRGRVHLGRPRHHHQRQGGRARCRGRRSCLPSADSSSATVRGVAVDAPLAKTSVEVAPVRGFRDLREFVSLPFRLHAGTPWTPPLKLERYQFLNRRLNPYFRHADAECFLARRDGRAVGRISAQIDHAFCEYHGSRWGMFGFLEFEDDQEVVEALLDTAAAWLQQRGRERMVGPMDFQMNDEAGVLVEGFDLEPMIKQPWHPPYYQQRCETAGLTKAMDLFHWDVLVTDRDNRMHPIVPRLAERSRTK